MHVGFTLLPGESGHQNCAITLARRLEQEGHRITFIGLADDAEPIRAKGFEYVVLAADTNPPDTRESWKANFHRGGAMSRLLGRMRQFSDTIDEVLLCEEEIRGLRLDVVVCDGLSRVGALFALRLRLPCVLLHTTLLFSNTSLPPLWSRVLPKPDGRMPLAGRIAWWAPKLFWFLPQLWLGYAFNRYYRLSERQLIRRICPHHPELRKLGDLQKYFLNLVACPREFELPHPVPAHVEYIDPLVDGTRQQSPFDGSQIPPDRRVIYASMGTQTWLMRKPERFFRELIECFRGLPEEQLVLSLGKFIDPGVLGEIPPNVSVHTEVPQLAVLARASLMITHGGLNSIKEAILAGVPLIALPIQREQPGNSARVQFHQLGRMGDYRRISAQELREMVLEVLDKPDYRRAVLAMREVFQEAERQNRAVRLLCEAAGRPPASLAPEVAVGSGVAADQLVG